MSDTTSALISWAFVLLCIGGPALAFIAVILFKAAKAARWDGTLYRVWGFICGALASGAVVISLYLGLCVVNVVDIEGVNHETHLNADYGQSENVLSTYVTSFEEQLGVDNLQTTKLQALITSAIAGQANIKDMVEPGKSPLYLAVAQAYPNVTLAQYEKLSSFIQDGRQSFQDSQATLLKDLSDYDAWQHGGFVVQPGLVRMLGFQSRLLHINVGGRDLYGAEAEAEMWKLVINPRASAEFASHTTQALPIHG